MKSSDYIMLFLGIVVTILLVYIIKWDKEYEDKAKKKLGKNTKKKPVALPKVTYIKSTSYCIDQGISIATINDTALSIGSSIRHKEVKTTSTFAYAPAFG